MQNLTWIIVSVLCVISGILSQQTCSSSCMRFQRFLGSRIWNMTGLLSFTFRSSGFGNCSITCYHDQSCGFFSYNDQSSVCSGFSAIAEGIWEPSLTRSLTGTVYYRGLHSVFVNDSVSGLFIGISDNGLNGTEASAACSKRGQRLLILDTFAKRQRIATLLTTFDIMMNRQMNHYWIDLAFNTSQGSWFWDNGVPLIDSSPLNKNLLRPNQPCVSLNFKEDLKAVPCTKNPRRSICERL